MKLVLPPSATNPIKTTFYNLPLRKFQAWNMMSVICIHTQHFKAGWLLQCLTTFRIMDFAVQLCMVAAMGQGECSLRLLWKRNENSFLHVFCTCKCLKFSALCNTLKLLQVHTQDWTGNVYMATFSRLHNQSIHLLALRHAPIRDPFTCVVKLRKRCYSVGRPASDQGRTRQRNPHWQLHRLRRNQKKIMDDHGISLKDAWGYTREHRRGHGEHLAKWSTSSHSTKSKDCQCFQHFQQGSVSWKAWLNMAAWLDACGHVSTYTQGLRNYCMPRSPHLKHVPTKLKLSGFHDESKMQWVKINSDLDTGSGTRLPGRFLGGKRPAKARPDKCFFASEGKPPRVNVCDFYIDKNI